MPARPQPLRHRCPSSSPTRRRSRTAEPGHRRPRPPRDRDATQLDVPDVSHRAMLVMVTRLPDGGAAARSLNFSTVPLVEAVLRTEHAVPGTEILDLGTDEPLGEVDEEHGVHVVLGAHDGLVLRIG